mgnify:CR=1 FL=1|tara:strand:- start:3139 stop:4095 length:957 start_codon:yes stop_codon:yes gene_type:complete
MLDETLDNVIDPIDNSMMKKNVYSPEVSNNYPERHTYNESTGEIKKHIEMGNGVEQSGIVAKTKQPLYKDIFSGLISSLGTASEEVDKTLDNINANMGGIMYMHPTVLFSKTIRNEIEKTKAHKTVESFYDKNIAPKTDRAKMISEVAAELELFVANNLALKKLKWFSVGVKYLPKVTKKYAAQLFRWSTAEGLARGTMGEDEESVSLMLSDLAGLTNQNDLESIRNFYKTNLEQKTPQSEMKIRLANFLDGFNLGANAEIFMKLLMTNYGIISATGITGGFIEAKDKDSFTKESIGMDNNQHRNLIQEIQENPYLLD